MDRKDWLKKLQMELYRMPRNEIDDAVAYYSEYFEEAGPEREQEIISELGDPSKVAAQIKADYAVRQLDDLEREEARGERGHFWNRFSRRDPNESWQEHVGNTGGRQEGWQQAPNSGSGYGQNSSGGSAGYGQNSNGAGSGYGPNSGTSYGQNGGANGYNDYSSRQDGYRSGYNNGYQDARQTGRSKGRVGMLIAAVIGGILAAPIALPIAFLLIGLAIAGIVIVGAIIVGLVALAAGGVVAGIAVLISAFFTIGTTTAGMLVIIGAGLAIAGVSILVGFLAIKGAAALIRAISRGMANRRRRKQMAGGYQPGMQQGRRNADGQQAAGYQQPYTGYQQGDSAEDGFVQAQGDSAETGFAAAQSDSAEAGFAAAQGDSAEAGFAAAQGDSAQTGFSPAEHTPEDADIPIALDGEVNEDAGK